MKKLAEAAWILGAILLGGCGGMAPEWSGSGNTPVTVVSEITLEPPVPLRFEKVVIEQELQRIQPVGQPHIRKEQKVTGGKVVIYEKPDDEEQVYAAYVAQGVWYELGMAGVKVVMQADGGPVIDEPAIFGKSLIRIKGAVGANAPLQNYYAVEDGGIRPFLRVDTGHAEELDLDGDGTEEIVSSHGTPISTYLYRWDNGTFSIADLNEALGALSVYVDGGKRLHVSFEDAVQEELYVYQAGTLKKLRPE